MDVVAGNEGEILGAEIELRRGNALAEGLRRGEVAVKRPVPDLVAEKRFDAFDDPVVIIEGRQEIGVPNCPSSRRLLASL